MFFALGGAAVAASHYIITSKHQIAPAVIKQLEKAGPKGATGAAGVAGVAGTPGAAGTFSAANVSTVSSIDTAIPAYGTVQAVATCPAGDTVIGGGFRGGVTAPLEATVTSDGPTGTTEWAVSITDNSGAASDFYAEAVCAS